MFAATIPAHRLYNGFLRCVQAPLVLFLLHLAKRIVWYFGADPLSLSYSLPSSCSEAGREAVVFPIDFARGEENAAPCQNDFHSFLVCWLYG